MKIAVYGSLNIDYHYSLPHIVQAKETLQATSLHAHLGGKGANQAIALHHALGDVTLLGCINEKDTFIQPALQTFGLSTSHLQKSKAPHGHAMIQVDEQGQNAIVVFPGTNHENDLHQIKKQLLNYDVLVLQNEVNGVQELMHYAKQNGKYVVFNASPIHPKERFDLMEIDVLVVNEMEMCALLEHHDPKMAATLLTQQYPHLLIVLTLGEEGSLTYYQNQRYQQTSLPTEVVDTTGAGDTYLGYFIQTYLQTHDLPKAMYIASIAAKLCVSKMGAAPSIPTYEDVMEYYDSQATD